MRSLQSKTIIQAIIAVVLFGSIGPAIKLTSANAATIGIVRLLFALIIAGVWVTVRKEWRRPLKKEALGMFWIGLIFAIHWITIFIGTKLTSASLSMVGVASYGIHLFILSTILQRQRVHLSDVLGLSLAIVGNILVVPDWSISSNATLGLLICILSGFFYALLPLMHQSQASIPTSLRTFGQFFVAFIFFLLLLPFSDWNLSSTDWYALLYLAIACTVIAHTLWVQVTTVLAPAVTSIIYYAGVPVTLFLGHFLLGEKFSYSLAIGSLLIIIGNILSLSSRIKKTAVLR